MDDCGSELNECDDIWLLGQIDLRVSVHNNGDVDFIITSSDHGDCNDEVGEITLQWVANQFYMYSYSVNLTMVEVDGVDECGNVTSSNEVDLGNHGIHPEDTLYLVYYSNGNLMSSEGVQYVFDFVISKWLLEANCKAVSKPSKRESD